jgi:cytoskeletal protein RodZ
VTAPDRSGPRRLIGGLGTVVSRVGKGRGRDVDGGRTSDGTADGEAADEPAVRPQPVLPAASSTSPLRQTRHALRAQVTRDTPATVLGGAALLSDDLHDPRGRSTLLPEHRELRRPDGAEQGDGVDADDGRVQPIATLGDPVEPLVVDDYVTEPAYDPVIGPELAAARTRVGLSVDELAERTRIRPHVIESIEVDDFAPCGGDFYARGHLRTLARVLGRDAAPLLEQFDNRYATAPINARRVFEAELATGMTGSMRSTVGGPNWALLVGVVLALVMTWGVVRLFASEPPEVLQPSPVLNGSAGVADLPGPRVARAPVPTPAPVRMTLTGVGSGSLVVVRDRTGKVVWAGELVAGHQRAVRATPPVRVQADDGGAVTVSVNGSDQGTVGASGVRGHRTFTRPEAR